MIGPTVITRGGRAPGRGLSTGREQTELDALIALHPGVLQQSLNAPYGGVANRDTARRDWQLARAALDRLRRAIVCRGEGRADPDQQPRRARWKRLRFWRISKNLELRGLRRPVVAFNVVQSTSAADARPNLTVVARGPGARS
jgi:hypothetical protein